MDKLSHFILGVAYTLSTKAIIQFWSIKPHITDMDLLSALLLALAMGFIYVSVVWITFYWINLVHDALESAVKYEERK